MSNWWKGCRQCDRPDAHTHGERDGSYEIRYQQDRTGAVYLDEIVASGCDVHLEQMTKSAFWLGIDLPDGRHLRVWLETRNRKGWVEATVDVDEPPP